ncbi:MAG: hypothetical protein Q9195_001165 [Heterodermia aff. obscurata]
MAAFGFSVGDFLAAIDLVKDLAQALSESNGAKTKYQEHISQLYTLERALIALKSLDPSQADYDAVQHAVAECQLCIAKFLKRVEKFQSLTAGTTSLKDQIRKVKWGLYHEKDMKDFKKSLDLQIESLMLLFLKSHHAHSVVSSRRTEQLLTEQAKVLDLLQAQNAGTRDVQDQILADMKRLLLVEQKDKNPFEIRPFKLVGAPLTPAFVERQGLMSQIETVLLPVNHDQQTILVLHGLGGIGKSQLAREYATRHQYDYSAIFWINAQTESSLNASMVDIARRVGLTVELDESQPAGQIRGMPKSTTAVLDWLQKDGNSGWLLVFDNVDSQMNDLNDDMLQESLGYGYESFDASPYLPSTSQGTLLITSRLSYLARQFGGIPINIDRMSIEEGLELLSKLSGQSTKAKCAQDLVEKLGAYPLALSQAGRFMYETSTSCENFLRLYDSRIKALMKQKPSRREYQNGSIKAALEMSFDVLKTRDPRAAALLMLLGQFDSTDIFHDLFRFQKQSPEECYPQPPPLFFPGIDHLPPNWIEDMGIDNEHYEEAVRSLLAFSFVSRNVALESISIHPVVHEWILLFSADLGSLQCLPTAANVLALTHCAIWRGNLLDTEYGRSVLSRMRPHVDRFTSLMTRGCRQGDIAPSDLVIIGTYYLYQYNTSTAQALIDLGLSRISENMMEVKVWFYVEVLRMHVVSGQTGEDRINFTRRLQQFADSIQDPAAFTLVGGRDVVNEQLFGCLFMSYIDEKLYPEALELSHLRLKQVEIQLGAQYSIHNAKVCQACALIEIGEVEEAIELGESCRLSLDEWASTLPADTQGSERMFDRPDFISKDLSWVLGKAYTRIGQQER